MSAYNQSLHVLADFFVADLLRELHLRLTEKQIEALSVRAAGAMQQAVEDELVAIRRQLTAPETERPIAPCGFCVGVDLGSAPDWSSYRCDCGYESRSLAEALEHARRHGWQSLAIGSPSRK